MSFPTAAGRHHRWGRAPDSRAVGQEEWGCPGPWEPAVALQPCHLAFTLASSSLSPGLLSLLLVFRGFLFLGFRLHFAGVYSEVTFFKWVVRGRLSKTLTVGCGWNLRFSLIYHPDWADMAAVPYNTRCY